MINLDIQKHDKRGGQKGKRGLVGMQVQRQMKAQLRVIQNQYIQHSEKNKNASKYIRWGWNFETMARVYKVTVQGTRIG